MANKFKIDDFLWINPDNIRQSTLEWLAERQAQKRYSKDVDLFILNETGVLNSDATRLILNLSREQNFNDQIFYKTEKMISFNNGQVDNAEVFWLLDYDASEPIVTLCDEVIAKTEYKNKVISIEIVKQIIESSGGVDYYVLEYRSKEMIETYLASGKNYLRVEDINTVPQEVRASIEWDLEIKDWPLDFEPFVHIQNTPEGKSDANFIQHELDELAVVSQKKRDDILLSSVKIVGMGPGHNNKKKDNTMTDTAEDNLKKYASQSVIANQSLGFGDAPATVIANAVPNTDTYDRAIRTLLNSMLKKTGGATDVDSKGTVQQSKGEVLMSQGDEYKVSKWKAKNRQEKIKELFTKIWKIYTTVLKITNPFKNAERLFVIISQEEVLSELEMLENLNKAEQYGYTNKVISYARYNGLNVIDAYDMMQMQLGALDVK